jgi:hypothetical protein
VLLAILMALASVPILATEVVCVVGPTQVAIPLAKCGMPCCAHGGMASVDCQHGALAEPSCCHPKGSGTAVTKDHSNCPVVSGQSCRCETRVSAGHFQRPPAERAATLQFKFLSIALPSAQTFISLPVESGGSEVFGADSSPPRSLNRSPISSRAPPSRLNA